MSDSIDITDHAPACIHLWGDSALGYAAYGPVAFGHSRGRIYLSAVRPVTTFSSGEKHLWDCLVKLADGHTLTEADVTGCPDLDERNVRVLAAVRVLNDGVTA